MLEVKETVGGGVRIVTLIKDGSESAKAVMKLDGTDIHLSVGECETDAEYDFLTRACLHKLRDFKNFTVTVEESEYFSALGFTDNANGLMSVLSEKINSILLSGAHYEK